MSFLFSINAAFLIAVLAGWTFVEFFLRMSPVTMPVLFFGLLTCILLEKK
ncbi:MAG: hypothetical protein OEO19_15080 [Gammaproteobacteria bacterium]|nr:hypothetical protein [Gammaproteobacteria bacterium]MDH3447678.1 hypothetical protein [Gammaproteobacteria bacterium]